MKYVIVIMVSLSWHNYFNAMTDSDRLIAEARYGIDQIQHLLLRQKTKIINKQNREIERQRMQNEDLRKQSADLKKAAAEKEAMLVSLQLEKQKLEQKKRILEKEKTILFSIKKSSIKLYHPIPITSLPPGKLIVFTACLNTPSIRYEKCSQKKNIDIVKLLESIPIK